MSHGKETYDVKETYVKLDIGLFGISHICCLFQILKRPMSCGKTGLYHM